MNVLQVTPTRIHPPSMGGQNRAHGLVVSYPDHGDEVRRFAMGGILSNHDLPNFETRVDVTDGITELRPLNPLFDVPSIPPVLLGTPGILAGPILRRVPSRRFRSLLSWADLIQVEMPYQVPAVATMAEATPVVYSSHNVESLRWMSVNGTSTLRNRWSHEKIRAIEERALQAASLVVCTSERDREQFQSEYRPETRIVVAPNGIFRENLCDCEAVDPDQVRESRGIQSGSFVGVFVGSGYDPNVEAAELLVGVAEALPSSDFEVVLVGSVCEAFDEGQLPENVTATGFVEDLDPVLCAADVGLNPIVSGGGTNIKVLDYLARRLPVVSTPFGARGFDFRDDSPVVVTERDNFGSALEALRQDQERYEHLQDRAMAYARGVTWDRISSQLRGTLADLVDGERDEPEPDVVDEATEPE